MTEVEHGRRVMQPEYAVPDLDEREFSRLTGGEWKRLYSGRKMAACTFVFQNCSNTNDIRVLSNVDETNTAKPVCTVNNQQLYMSSFFDDKALIGLRTLVADYVLVEVLRYRPGKRITLLLLDDNGTKLVVKYVARGIDAITQIQSSVYCAAGQLGFNVSQPLWCSSDGRAYAQTLLPGSPVDYNTLPNSAQLAKKIAVATQSLHISTIQFKRIFTVADQQRRTERYVRYLHQQFPDYVDWLQRFSSATTTLQQAIEQHSAGSINTGVPIHGSLHSHQWLYSGSQLSLVDFDRAAMGDAELDIATFLTEWAYEKKARGEVFSHAFIEVFQRADQCKLAFYCAHKHLAKAFKYARSVKPDAAVKVASCLATAVSAATSTKEYQV
jgi:hypothetical protein